MQSMWVVPQEEVGGSSAKFAALCKLNRFDYDFGRWFVDKIYFVL